MNNEREQRSFRGWSLVCCLCLLLSVPAWASAQSRFSGIVVFGTSLSDPGNSFALYGDAGKPPDFMLNPLLIPSAPYAKGGHHFSNGATWIEQYAKSIGLGDSVRPALAITDRSVTNFAVGAARAYDDGVNFNLSRQVNTFLQRSGGAASAQALYVVEMGSNDVRDAFQVYATGGDGGPILKAALGSIAANIQKLYVAGARNFLVWVVPDVSLTPALRTLPPAAQGLAALLTQGFNANLAAIVAQLSAALPGISIVRLDAYQLLHEIVDDPALFNLSTVAVPCLDPSIAPFTCGAPDDFLFWDGIHPTKAGHAILAGEAADVVP
jgi:phospholipase/lecithinase/hemolysin